MHLQRKNQHCTNAFILNVLFFAVKSKRAFLCACTILCALVDHLLEQNRSFLMIFLKIFHHLEMGM
jgi:hypothetical protein